MDYYLKVIACVLITAVLGLILSKQAKDYTVLMTICVCSMIILCSAKYLKAIIQFLQHLSGFGGVDKDILRILLKISGIGLISQIIGLICEDAGNHSLGKALQIITTVVILWLSLPLLEEMLILMESVLGAI